MRSQKVLRSIAMSRVDGIDGNYKVNRTIDDYNSKPIDNKKKFKEELNSIHVPYASVAYMPAGGIGNILNGSQNTTGATQA